MACILTLMGSIVGFVAGLTALVLFQAPLLAALGIWAAVGVAGVALGLVFAEPAKPQDDAIGPQELA
jgi:dolichol kinase